MSLLCQTGPLLLGEFTLSHLSAPPPSQGTHQCFSLPVPGSRRKFVGKHFEPCQALTDIVKIS